MEILHLERLNKRFNTIRVKGLSYQHHYCEACNTLLYKDLLICWRVNTWWWQIDIHRWYSLVHYNDIIMSAVRLKSPASRLFTQPFIQCANQRKHQSSASLAFVQGIHRWPVNSPHKSQWRGKYFHLMTSSWKVNCAPIHTCMKSREDGITIPASTLCSRDV